MTHFAPIKPPKRPRIGLYSIGHEHYWNLQPTADMDYERTSTGEWLAHCVSCCVPEIANAFHRSNIDFHLVSGLLGLEQTPSISLTDEKTAGHPEAIAAWQEIEDSVGAAWNGTRNNQRIIKEPGV